MTDTPKITEAEIARLRELAEAVEVPGAWAVWRDLPEEPGFYTVGDAESFEEIERYGETDECDPVANVYTEALAEFIAAANPQTVIALLDAVKAQAEPPAEEWEYGFYDSEYPERVWWYCFGQPFTSPEMAKHTGDKSVMGQTVVVRHRKGAAPDEWEPVAPKKGTNA